MATFKKKSSCVAFLVLRMFSMREILGVDSAYGRPHGPGLSSDPAGLCSPSDGKGQRPRQSLEKST